MAVIRFGIFELDAAAGELRRQGRRVHLAAQPLKVLALLAERAGTIVSREQLRRHVWDAGTFVEFDRSLNFCVAEVRRALGDSARNPRFIETVARHGYRFIADVHPVAGAALPAAGSTAPSRPDHSARRWGIAAAALLLAAQYPFRPPHHTRDTARPEARAAFERAMQLADEGDAGRRRSIAALRLATRIDPRFAEAHFALADLYLTLAEKRELPIDAAIAEARDAAERAVALEEMPESRRLLGTIRLIGDWDWSGARNDLARAVALAPKWDLGFVGYARVLSATGDDAAAVAAIDRAETLSPNCDLILFDAGQIYARAGRLDEALEKLERAIVFGPPRQVAAADWQRQVRARQLMIHLARGDWPAAHKTASALVALSGASDDARQRFDAQEAKRAVTAFLARSVATSTAAAPGGRVWTTHVAALEALRGNSEKALEWLEKAAAERDPDLVFALRDPEFTALRAMPRYRALEARIRRSS